MIGRRDGNGQLVPYYDRAAIEAGALDGQKVEICWLKDPLDLLAIQIEGCGRVILEDGAPLRINYDSHNGYSFSSLSRARCRSHCQSHSQSRPVRHVASTRARHDCGRQEYAASAPKTEDSRS
jgi:hypothetical protein